MVMGCFEFVFFPGYNKSDFLGKYFVSTTIHDHLSFPKKIWLFFNFLKYFFIFLSIGVCGTREPICVSQITMHYDQHKVTAAALFSTQKLAAVSTYASSIVHRFFSATRWTDQEPDLWVEFLIILDHKSARCCARP
jgi:hypothetical protein